MQSASSAKSSRKALVLVSLFISTLGCVLLYSQISGAEQPQMDMMAYQMLQPLKAQAQHAEARAIKAAAAGIHAQSMSRHAAAGKSWAYATAIGWAARDGARVGCRGSLA